MITKIKYYYETLKDYVLAAVVNFQNMTFESKMGSVFLLISIVLLVLLLTSCGSPSTSEDWLYRTV